MILKDINKVNPLLKTKGKYDIISTLEQNMISKHIYVKVCPILRKSIGIVLLFKKINGGKYFMKKKISLLFLAIFIVGIMVGCGSNESMSKKVELRDEPVKSSSDYGNGTGNISSGSTNKDNNTTSDTLKVGFIQTANESGWRAAHTQSMKDTFDTDEYTYTFVDGQGDQAVQIAGMERFINEDYDVIILDPIVEEGWDNILKKAQNADIPVIVVDRMVSSDSSLYSCWIGSDFEKEGKDAAQWLVDNKGTTEAQNIVILEGTKGASAQLGRTTGFDAVISQYDNYTVLASEDGDFDKAKGKELMKNYMGRFDKIDVIVTQNDNMAYGVIEAINEAGKKPSDYTIISFDGEANAFKEMINGNIAVDIECNPLQGPTIEAVMKKLLAGETVEKKLYMEEGVYPASVAAQEVANRKY